MPHRPHPDRIDDYGFTTLETAALLKRSVDRIQHMCNAIPGFGIKMPDGSWRVQPIAALAAAAIVGEHGKIGVKEFNRRTFNGVKTLRTLGRRYTDDPAFRAFVIALLETALRPWWDRRHGAQEQPPPSGLRARARARGGGECLNSTVRQSDPALN
jgi:hypothetical protein